MISQDFPKVHSTKYSRLIKLVLDRLIAASALLILSPLILIVATAISFRMGYPILFTQLRPGKDARIFKLYKFRTMTDARDTEGNLLRDEKRLTSFGQFLRKTSLDELPQLWNVLKGDMSFVGPRPLLVRYLDRYTSEQARRHDIMPGITGWTQVKGRNALSWEEKFKLDVWYVDNWSLWLDLKILFLTVFKVLQQEGINQEGFVTSEEFKGQGEHLNSADISILGERREILKPYATTPEKQERLQACLQELAILLYEQTNKSELHDWESIEKTVQTQILKQVSPQITLFYQIQNKN